jgi:hypothetical protein
MKICKRCGITKPIGDFGKNKNNKDGCAIYCKECEKFRGKKYRKENPDYKISSKTWRTNNPEKYSETIKKYLKANSHMSSTERSKKYRQDEVYREKEKERAKKYAEDNKEKLIEYRKFFYQQHKVRLRKANDEYKKKIYKEDGFYRMKKNLRDRVREFLFENNKSIRTKNIVGLDSCDFKSYIEEKFTEGMSWENYGFWHLDHIKPLSLAKNLEEVMELNYYTNLQPLWAEDNLKKNNKYND